MKGQCSSRPERKARISAKLPQVAVGFYEGVLHGLFGVFSISKDGQRHSEDPTFMPSYQRLEGPRRAYLSN